MKERFCTLDSHFASKQQKCERTHLDQSGHQQDCDTAFGTIVLLHSLHHTIKANSKIAKERIWINPVTSKIVVQPSESDADAQLHEERVITVRNAAETCLSSSTRENVQDEMRTSWKLSDVTKFQEEIKIAQKTAATPHVP